MIIDGHSHAFGSNLTNDGILKALDETGVDNVVLVPGELNSKAEYSLQGEKQTTEEHRPDDMILIRAARPNMQEGLVYARFLNEASEGFFEKILSEYPHGSRFRIRMFSVTGKWLSHYMGPRGKEEYYLEAIAVSAKMRGKGLGQRLLGQAVDTAIGKGAKVLALDVSSKNNKAIRSYKKFGMEITSVWPDGSSTEQQGWKALHEGHSSLCIVDRTIFTTGKRDYMDVCIALRKCGGVLWESAYGRSWNGSNPETRCTPVYDQGTLQTP